MQHFTKSLLATAILFGLTACGSGGGGSGSNEPTTSSGTAATTVNNTAAIPAQSSQSLTTAATENTASNTSSQTNSSSSKEIITVPTTENRLTEQTFRTKNWEQLPPLPKIETSSIRGTNINNVSGKATYLSQNNRAMIYNKSNSYDNYKSSLSSNEYILLNADFDAKKISGSAAMELSDRDNTVKAQSELIFQEARLYKNIGDGFNFRGDSIGKIKFRNGEMENLSGTYNGSIDSPFSNAEINYLLSSDSYKLVGYINKLPKQ